jgi:hypothetical protein
MPTRITVTIIIECPDEAVIRVPTPRTITCPPAVEGRGQVSPAPGVASPHNTPEPATAGGGVAPIPTPAVGAEADPATSDPPPVALSTAAGGGGGAADDVVALGMLLRHGVKDASRLMALYRPERIIAAVRYTEQQVIAKENTDKPILSTAAYIKTALRKGWTL